MMQRARSSRGYSLAELMTVVGMVGIVALVGLPALMQLMPQYRIRGAASEMTASLRMIRQRAISTRSQWKMVVDPVADSYTLWEMVGGTWTQAGADGHLLPPGVAGIGKFSVVDIQMAAPLEVIFFRDGTASGTFVTPPTAPTDPSPLVLAVDSSWVTFNRYTVDIDTSGNITVTPSKV
jgi:type II secretory pathway pseudopilin PulG